MQSRTVALVEDDVEIIDTEGPDSDVIAAYFAEANKGFDKEVRSLRWTRSPVGFHRALCGGGGGGRQEPSFVGASVLVFLTVPEDGEGLG